MSYQEKKALLNFFVTLTVLLTYSNYVYTHYWNAELSTDELLLFWSKYFLIYMGVQIVIHILVHILVNISRGMANGGKLVEEIEDEFDKIIELKSTRNSMVTFSLSLIAGFIFLAAGYSINAFFLTLLIGGMTSEAIDAISRITYYRRGV